MVEQLADVFAVIRDRGSFHAAVEAFGDDLPAFRAQLKARGRAEGIRVLTRVVNGTFIAYWPEHEPTELQTLATHRAIRTMWDEQPIGYDEALEQVRREQIRAV